MTEAELSDERLAELLSGCEGVTPGPWGITHDASDDGERYIHARYPQGNGNEYVSIAFEMREPELRHLVNCDPGTIRALATELQRRRAAQAARKAQTDADASGGTSGHVPAKPAELLPCPFCGEKPVVETDAKAGTLVRCASMHCFGPTTSWRWLGVDAIVAWNRRTPDIARGEEAGDWVLVPREPTPEMIEVALVEAGWKTEPYRAPRESGVPTESDISQADADSINAAGREAMASTYRVMILRAAPCTFCANGNDLPDGEQCQCCGRIGDLPPGADAPNRAGGGE